MTASAMGCGRNDASRKMGNVNYGFLIGLTMAGDVCVVYEVLGSLDYVVFFVFVLVCV